MLIPSTWYSGGPPVSFLPLPVMDKDRPWGSSNCEECNGFCHGHYVKPERISDNHSSDTSLPPSVVIQQFFVKLKGEKTTEDELTLLAQKVLLPNRKYNCGWNTSMRFNEIDKEEQLKLLKPGEQSEQLESNLNI